MRDKFTTSFLLGVLAGLMILAAAPGCVPEPEPDYCYRVGTPEQQQNLEAWYCEGNAQWPADTLPDDLKGEHEPRDIPHAEVAR